MRMGAPRRYATRALPRCLFFGRDLAVFEANFLIITLS
jgi:hypothetical protein